MDFIRVPAGTFMMGYPIAENGGTDDPQHKVTIAYDFWLGKYPVTQAQWLAVMGCNPSKFTQDIRKPVEQVTWRACGEFLESMNDLSVGKIRLPSEAEWEYAARAGTVTRYYFGNEEAQFGDYVWCKDNSGGMTQVVGQKQPNAWGLHDILGNVWEWCQDCWHDNYVGAPTDGKAWEDPMQYRHVLRGGSWNSPPGYCASFLRNVLYQGDTPMCEFGLRLARTADDIIGGTKKSGLDHVPTQRDTPLNYRLRRLREEGERKRAELEEVEHRRKEEEFELLQGTLAEQLDREAFDEAWKTVGELRKLKPDDAEVQEAAKLIADQMGHRGGGSVLMLPGGVTMEFVPIPPGTFLMGSPDTEVGRSPSEGPQHQVTIAYPFSLGKYPVTQAQWQVVMGTSVTDQWNKANPEGNLPGIGPDYPMYYVSWHESQEFIKKLNAMGLGAYRLPSEAEWEYACRAGTQTRYHFGDHEAQLDEYAWYEANSEPTTHPVGEKKSNAWGVYDVHGNVLEWCQDWYHGNYAGAPVDGSAWEVPSGQNRVLRGSRWLLNPVYRRAANRSSSIPPGRQSPDIGFRLLRTDSSAERSRVAAEVSQPERPRIEIVSSPPKAVEPSQEEIILALPGGVTMEFVPIPPGTFLMGSPESEPGRQPNEGPQHQVTIAYPFWLGKYPVTQAQWQAVMGNNPSHFQGDIQCPVELVSWDDCQVFIQKVNAIGQGVYRLPSEAEWEYACRAGAQTRYHFGENEAELGEYAWHVANSGQTTHPVGQKKPNASGLYDVHGNVWEWCQDWFHETYAGASADGSAWETPSGQSRVLRGGSWSTDRVYCCAVYRGCCGPNFGSNSRGFRLARTR